MTLIKDKEITKAKLIEAVGEIIKESGYTGLGVNKIAKRAEVDKCLIYRYFSGFDGLIEAYVLQRDYWLRTNNNAETFVQRPDEGLKEFVSRLLVEQFDYFNNSEEMQELIYWEISERNELLNSISRTREIKAGSLLARIDDEVSDNTIDFRSLSALLVAGIYYLNLHRRVNDSSFCELDINDPEDRQKLRKTITQLIYHALE
ncbi:TetR/AcrR family transcriptional regulator [uncultured Pedobacter sp.]|uniref:TetR/AcrR family transcriptional regulator n=1 Tax=uncultured Pedobacter sp. TaxID=246139 RepID=UPI0025DCD63A|nr:TetR/AcrR family transcriptional regulator [uncultured Pedobacter sp.]